jgi:hypothetical protein
MTRRWLFPGWTAVVGVVVAISNWSCPGCDDASGCGPLGPVTEWEAELRGDNQIPPVTTNAAGRGAFRLTTQSQVAYTITIATLPATAITSAAFYRGPPNTNSDSVAVGLCGTGSPAPPCAAIVAPGVLIAAIVEITPAQLNVLRSYGYYANVRTVGNPNGEIRGQVRNVAP